MVVVVVVPVLPGARVVDVVVVEVVEARLDWDEGLRGLRRAVMA